MKERFLQIWYENIQRDGSDALLNWLCKSDFFTAPASTRFHGSYEGGLCEHSVNVFERMVKLVEAMLPEDKRPSMETIAIVSLCHDLCKVGVYQTKIKWRKDNRNQWESYSSYEFDDQLPYGHGEKSVYIISGFMKLSREEAMAIRWHMGFGDIDFKGGGHSVGNAFEKFPLAVLTHMADMAASYLDEERA